MNAADEAECKLLSDLVQEHFGLSFSGVRRDILASRVRPRIAALRLGNLLDYYHYLRSHPRRESELDELVRHLTNRGIGVLITDHNVRETLDLVSRAYIIHDGMVLTHGTAQEIINNEDVRRVYLGDQFKI